MSQSNILFVGMDVHKDSISVAYISDQPGAELVPVRVIISPLYITFLSSLTSTVVVPSLNSNSDPGVIFISKKFIIGRFLSFLPESLSA